MLTQQEVDFLLELLKQLIDNKDIQFPGPSDSSIIEAVSATTNDKFLIDISRKGHIKVTKCTFQTRYKKSYILLRLEIDGPNHTNPDGTEIPCPHIHIYREGYGTSWAHPLQSVMQTDPTNMVQVLIDFLKYNNISNIPTIFEKGTLFQ